MLSRKDSIRSKQHEIFSINNYKSFASEMTNGDQGSTGGPCNNMLAASAESFAKIDNFISEDDPESFKVKFKDFKVAP